MRSGIGMLTHGVVRRIWNFRRIEKQLSRLPSTSYMRWVGVAYRLGCLRRPAPAIRFSRREDGIWKVTDSDETLLIASHRRAPRYLRAGIRGVKDSLIDRYFPDPSKRMILKNAIVVDIGANVGEFSLACLDYGAKRLVAVEPDSIPFTCLKDNLQSRKPDSIVKRCVLSKEIGKVTFYVSTENADSSFIKPDDYTDVLEMDATTLDDIVERNKLVVDVLKIEAEGAEPEVLLGALKTLREQSPYVTVRASCERFGQSTFADCQSILGNLGYECVDGGAGKQLLAAKPGTSPLSMPAP